MSSCNRKADGFRIKVATGAPQGDGILLTDADLASMSGVKPIVLSLRKAFKGKLAPAILIDGEVFLACLTDGETMPLSAAQVVVDTMETVADLEANASKEHPAPIEQVTKITALANILEVAADSFRRHGTRLVVQHDASDWEVPTLDPSVFVRPEKPETLEMSGTYVVRGIDRDENTGGHLMRIGASKLEIALPLNDPEWAFRNIWWSVDTETHLVARLRRACSQSHWEIVGKAKLVPQGDLLETPEV